VLAVGGGIVLLFVIADLVSSPSSDDEPTVAGTTLVVEPIPDPATPVAPVIPPTAPVSEPPEEVRFIPTGVRIPAIRVDAITVAVGLESDGSMEIPSDVSTIGWYEPAEGSGVAPGQPGTAVLAGHVDSRTQGAGAFYDLRMLAVGDRIEIVNADGSTSLWRVTLVTSYPKDELPIDDVFVWTGPPRLALITCGGPFDWTARSYFDNLVVYAEPDVPAGDAA
jgi:sortase (surface protein transpeptidase)